MSKPNGSRNGLRRQKSTSALHRDAEAERRRQAEAAAKKKKNARKKKAAAAKKNAAKQRAAASMTPEQRAEAQRRAAARRAAYEQMTPEQKRAYQQKRAMQKRRAQKKKKSKIANPRRFITCLVCLFLIILLLVLIIKGIAGHGSKKGWYSAYVKPASSKVRIGVVTKLDKDGNPLAIDIAEKNKDGVYTIPVQYGGTATVIVANRNYSFNHINAYDRDYYLTSITAAASEKTEKQEKFLAKYKPSVVYSKQKTISTEGDTTLPAISICAKSNGKKQLASAKLGDKQPVVRAKDLDYISKAKPEAPKKTTETAAFTFTASGDNVISEAILDQCQGEKSYDFDSLYKDVSSFYQQHDLNMINQETLASSSLDISGSEPYSSPGSCVQSLYDEMKVQVFSIANENIYDYGSDGVNATAELYQAEMGKRVIQSGLYLKKDLYDIPVISANGRSVAVLSYTTSTEGRADPEDTKYRTVTLDETKVIKKQLKKAREVADVVIVSCHWGSLGNHTITADQKTKAQDLADWGADLIVGNGPAVVQNAEWLNSEDGREVFCAYSLGTFMSTMPIPDELISVVLECSFNVSIEPNGTTSVTVQKPQLIPVITSYDSDTDNIHNIWYSDYTEEDAADHGVRLSYPSFGYSYISYMLKAVIDDDFLVLPIGQEATDSKDAANAVGTAAITTTAAATAPATSAYTTTARVVTTAPTTTAAPTTASTTAAGALDPIEG